MPYFFGMSVQLNHTIVHAYNQLESATFVAEILGLAKPERLYHFLVVRTDNGVSLDFLETTETIQTQHYAFLVSEAEFDQIFGRIQARGLIYWADPACSRAGVINTNDGGRGVYFQDPSKNLLEILTVPYDG